MVLCEVPALCKYLDSRLKQYCTCQSQASQYPILVQESPSQHAQNQELIVKVI